MSETQDSGLMTNLTSSILQPLAWLAETGLSIMGSAMKSMQSAVGKVSGQTPADSSTEPPLRGPRNIDEATADFANRLAVIARLAPLNSQGIFEAWNKISGAARQSFGGIDSSDPLQLLTLPLQLPLSFGTLLVDSGLRGLHASEVVGARDLPGLLEYAVEFFTDLEIFLGLQYKEYTSELERQVREDPKDGPAHLKLGKTYIKLGRYAEATRELAAAAEDHGIRAEAMRFSAVANYREGHFRQAVKDASAGLAADPSNDQTRFWLWLAAERLGGYPPEVPAEQRMEVKAGRHRSKVQFEDVAQQIGLDKTSGGRGTAVLDIDGDGHLDVVISSGNAGISVYRNNGDGTFTDVTVGSGLEDCVNTFAIIVGDYNNDGWDDLYVTRLGFYAGESVLYRNNGDGTFTDVTTAAGIRTWGPVFTAEWVDYDCDGKLDLFVPNNQGRLFDRKTPNRLFHNNGDGTFTEVSKQAGLESIYPSIGCAWGDYNNDGFPDLFVSSGFGRSQLFRNNGDGSFTDVSREAGVDGICLGSVSFWSDYDNDGWLDLIQLVWSPEPHVLHTLIHGEAPAEGHPLRIYHNNRDGTFTAKNRELGIDGCWGTMSGNMGDFNNDGHLDILLGNGGPPMDQTEPAIILENDGHEKFHNVTFAAGLPFTGKGHGANMADLAGDGRLCLIVAAGGSYPADLLTTSVFRPKTLPGNYLNVRLVGTQSNRSAIGARVRLEAGGRSQYRLVSGGSGFGCLPLEQHFGLGQLKKVDVLEIHWPSGLRQRIDNPPVNDTIRITEGGTGWDKVYPHKEEAKREAVLAIPAGD
jgi:tetratricopeptide (TPR) repeat protein